MNFIEFYKMDICKILKFILLIFFMSKNVDSFRYDGFSYIEIDPQRYQDIGLLKNFSKAYNNDEISFQFVHPPYRRGIKVSVIVSPDVRVKLIKLLDDSSITYDVKINDYQKLIDREFADNRQAIFQNFFRTGSNSDHTAYMRYSQIEEWLQGKVRNKPHAKFIKFGKTFENRKLFMVKISKNASLPIVWVDGGIHAREWVAVSTSLYIIDQLLNSSQPILDRFQFQIVPVVNPDGYEFSHESYRLWRKNRRRFNNSVCYGVDMNRNYPYEWGGADKDYCLDQYQGEAKQSEFEVQSMIKQLEMIKDSLKLSISLHAYGQYILQPYSHSKDAFPVNYLSMTEVAAETSNFFMENYNQFYLTGRPPDILYSATGSSDDFMVGTLNVPYSYTIELPDHNCYGFVLPPRYIRPTGEQIFNALVFMANRVYDKIYQNSPLNL